MNYSKHVGQIQNLCKEKKIAKYIHNTFGNGAFSLKWGDFILKFLKKIIIIMEMKKQKTPGKGIISHKKIHKSKENVYFLGSKW